MYKICLQHLKFVTNTFRPTNFQSLSNIRDDIDVTKPMVLKKLKTFQNRPKLEFDLDWPIVNSDKNYSDS